MNVQADYFSILRRTDEIIDRFFGVGDADKSARYATETTYLAKNLERQTGDALQFLCELHQQIELNWQERLYSRAPSQENWRCEAFTHYDKERAGWEVILEREIVNAMGSPPWYNNVPTSSGLCGPSHDKARNVDLVYATGPDEFTFYELKWDANTPLFAAVEIVLRGVLNIFSRQVDPAPLYARDHSSMLTAGSVHLRVLAPHRYFHQDSVNLGWLERRLDEGLRAFTERMDRGVRMDFGFEMLPEEFAPPFDREMIRVALSNRKPAYC